MDLPDKGHISGEVGETARQGGTAFGFAQCFLERAELAKSSALDATVACVTALRAIESIEGRKLVELSDIDGITKRMYLLCSPKQGA